MAITKKDLYRFGGLFLLFVVLSGKKKALAYFNIDEFDSPDKSGSGSKMDQSTLLMLDAARDIVEQGHNKYNPSNKIVFGINSGYRTPSHNNQVGGVNDSSHTKGLAVDIKIKSFEEGKIIAKALYTVGFRRFGIGSTFIHVDNDINKPYPAVWGYPSGTPAAYYQEYL